MCQLSSNLITLFKLIISTAGECKYKEKSSSVRNLIDMKLEEDGDCKKEEWAKIQENTFTRWVNHQLRSDEPLVSSLKTRGCEVSKANGNIARGTTDPGY